MNVSNHFIVNWASNCELYFKEHWFLIYAKTTFFNFYLENYLPDKKILNKKKMHLDAKSKHIFFISNFYAFRLFIDYRESNVQFKRRVSLFDPGIEFVSLSKFFTEFKTKFNICSLFHYVFTTQPQKLLSSKRA